PYMSSPIFVLLLTRLQTAKTDKFSQGLLKLIAFAAAIQKSDLSPDQVVGFVDGVQPGSVPCLCDSEPAAPDYTDRFSICPRLFGQVLPVLLPEVQKVPMKDRKMVAVGLGNLLTKSSALLNEPNVRAWYVSRLCSSHHNRASSYSSLVFCRTPTLEALLKLFNSPLPLAKNTSAADADEVDFIDPEDVGYQASFSKLGASEKPHEDPVGYVQDPRAHLAKGLEELGKTQPGKVRAIMPAILS
ncbi:MAG: hypothetical protein LBF18_23950, partial [Pantoea sp.]|nr:hypothetical protein [Pantoea sp.]